MTTVDNAPVLSVDDLVVDAADVRILDGVSVTLHRGQITALVGESGSGKSTVASAILGLLHPDLSVGGGRIVLDGVTDLTTEPERSLRRIRGRRVALVPQDPTTSLNPVRSIGAQLAEVFRVHRIGDGRADITQRCIDLLGRVGIDDPESRLRAYPHELSGGQKQRVLIAMAFALEPDVLVADEPTSALDTTVQKQVIEVFEDLVRTAGTAVLFVTHDLALAADHADRIVVMHSGRIVEDGATADVTTAPRHAYTRTLIAAATKPVPPARQLLDAATPLVTFADVTKNFTRRVGFRSREHTTVLDRVSFEVHRGRPTAIVGESGSGKTTTARILLGLTQATSGTIVVSGRDVRGLDADGRREYWRDVQLVHQNPTEALNPRHDVARLVSAPLVLHGIGDRSSRSKRVNALLDAVHLPRTVASRRPVELSGGQRQRVAVARAIALEPRLLVLDEPVSALDVVTRERILDLLDELRRTQDVTCVMITHDLSVARTFADDVVVLAGGRVVENGPVRTVLDAPESRAARDLVEAAPGRRLRETLDTERIQEKL